MTTHTGYVGAIALNHHQKSVYTKVDQEFLRRIASQAAPAIEKSFLLERAEIETEIQQSLAELGRIATSTLDISEIYDDVSKTISTIIPFDRLSISSINPITSISQIEYVTGTLMPNQEPGAQSAISRAAIEFLSDLGKSVVIDESIIGQFQELQPFHDIGTKHGLNSWFIAPLIWKGTPVGSLAFRHSKPNRYDHSHLRNANLLADQLAGAIANSISYRLERRNSDIQAALANVTMAVTQDLDLHKIYERLADELEHLIPHDRLAVVHYDRDTRDIAIEFARGITIPGEKIGADVTDTTDSQHWEQLIHAGDDPSDSERGQELRNLGLNSWVQAPIGLGPSGPDGFISLRSKTIDQYSDEDLDLLIKFCERVTPALQNARRFEQAYELAQQRQRADVLDNQNIELQRQADARSEFLSSVSHELRTPLTSISAFSDILSRNNSENLNERQLEQLEVIKRSTTSLATLIDDLIDESRAINGQLEINRQPFSVEETFSEVITAAQQIIAPKVQEIVVVDECENCWIDADKNRVVQILNNLISNASKYSSSKSQITFSVKRANGKLFIDVTDQGIGISTNDIGNIFTPFFRSPNDRVRSESGTGLGLAIVKTIVELHGGEIEAQSQIGNGTTISLWLPGVIDNPAI